MQFGFRVWGGVVWLCVCGEAKCGYELVGWCSVFMSFWGNPM